ncbi:MAG: electron transport complex subunit RsxE [Planctomycetota bacterium]|jgi:electron transport complex protein RnfE
MSDVVQLPSAGERFRRGVLPENPVFRQLLGMCPVLAVTNSMAGALTMGLATTFVLVSSNVVVSLLRKQLQPHLRILVYTLTIASFVTIADRFLAAFLPEMSLLLGPYVPLIIVNCLIISRAEACASKQDLGPALGDAFGQGAGFVLGLLSLGFIRELLGSGSLFGVRVLPDAWPDWLIMVLPPGAFLTLGMLIAVVNWWDARTKS